MRSVKRVSEGYSLFTIYGSVLISAVHGEVVWGSPLFERPLISKQTIQTDQ